MSLCSNCVNLGLERSRRSSLESEKLTGCGRIFSVFVVVTAASDFAVVSTSLFNSLVENKSQYAS